VLGVRGAATWVFATGSGAAFGMGSDAGVAVGSGAGSGVGSDAGRDAADAPFWFVTADSVVGPGAGAVTQPTESVTARGGARGVGVGASAPAESAAPPTSDRLRSAPAVRCRLCHAVMG